MDKHLICEKFLYDPDINPESGKTIKIGGPTFKKLVKLCRELKYDDDVDILLEAFNLQYEQPRSRSSSPMRVKSEQIRTRSPIITRSAMRYQTLPINKLPEKTRSRSPERIVNRSPERIVSRSPERIMNRSPERIMSRSPERIMSRSPERIMSRSRSPINYGLTGNRPYDKDIVLQTDLKTLVNLYNQNKRSIRKTVRDVLPQIIENNISDLTIDGPLITFIYDLLIIGEFDLVLEIIKLIRFNIYDLLAYKIGCDNIPLLAKLFKMAPQNHNWNQYRNLLNETHFFSKSYKNTYDDLISLRCQVNILDAAVMSRNPSAIKAVIDKNGWGFKDNRDTWQLESMKKKGYEVDAMLELVKRAENLVK